MIKTICNSNSWIGFELRPPNDLCTSQFQITTNIPEQLVYQYESVLKEFNIVQSQILDIIQNESLG